MEWKKILLKLHQKSILFASSSSTTSFVIGILLGTIGYKIYQKNQLFYDNKIEMCQQQQPQPQQQTQPHSITNLSKESIKNINNNQHSTLVVNNRLNNITNNNNINNKNKFNFIANVVEQTAPAVVYIEIQDYSNVKNFNKNNKNPKNNCSTNNFNNKNCPITISNGSGFLINSNGLILTNAHVIVNKPNSIILIKLMDGQEYYCDIEHIDYISDLATIRIRGLNANVKLPTLKFGNSMDLKSGEWIIALGSPLSLYNTVTVGIVSSTNRAANDLTIFEDDTDNDNNKNINIDKHNNNNLCNENSTIVLNYIQTDAAITFGNSGGPLINLNGEVIGVNCLKITTGISFAIPIDYVKTFLNKISNTSNSNNNNNNNNNNSKKSWINKSYRNNNNNNNNNNSICEENHHINNNYIGMTMLSLTNDIIKCIQQQNQHQYSEMHKLTNGVFIWKIIMNSIAYRCGLQSGDILTHINSHEIHSSMDVYKYLKNSASTTTKSLVNNNNNNKNIINLTIIRNNKTILIPWKCN